MLLTCTVALRSWKCDKHGWCPLQSGWEQPAGVVTLEPARSSGYVENSPTRQSVVSVADTHQASSAHSSNPHKLAVLQGSARFRAAQQPGEDAMQQEPLRVQNSPHRPVRQKTSSGSGSGSNGGIALTGEQPSHYGSTRLSF